MSMLLWPIVCIAVYDLRNSSVFSARLNAPSDGSDVIAGGSTFQTNIIAQMLSIGGEGPAIIKTSNTERQRQEGRQRDTHTERGTFTLLLLVCATVFH